MRKVTVCNTVERADNVLITHIQYSGAEHLSSLQPIHGSQSRTMHPQCACLYSLLSQYDQPVRLAQVHPWMPHCHLLLPALLQVYNVAGFTLDMVLLASTVVYLAALWALLTVATRGWDELAAMWSPKPSSRRASRGGGSRRS